jgi:pSer/pThr/pTyr-binding forkhead associated (FHA) protein
LLHPLWHHRYVTSNSLERLAQTAYEAHRGAHPGSLPAWEDTTEQEQQAWRAAVSAVAGQSGKTVAEAALTKSLLIQVGDQRHNFHTEFTAGRQGALIISDEFASNHHARFTTAHGFWYVEDLGSTNGTWLNGRRIHAAQRLKKGDKIGIGHTAMTVVST